MLYRDWVIRHCSHWPSVHPERSSWWRSEWDTLSSGKTGRTELQIAGYFQENLIFYEPICLHLSIFRKALKSLTKIIVPQRLAATFYWDLYLVACTSFTKIIYIYTHTASSLTCWNSSSEFSQRLSLRLQSLTWHWVNWTHGFYIAHVFKSTDG